MQKHVRFIYSVVALSIVALYLALASCGATPLTEVPPAMVGTWQGEATIIVAWVDQETLPVRVTIHPDSRVEGQAGDATLVDGSLRKNPLGSPYIIMADLDGPIVATEGIERVGVKMPLDFEEGQFVGGVATTGTEMGGKETMILTASDLVLTRIETE
ncbi:MAG: hypothetical protein R3C14_15845 [Caldilineaceae bacterium]